MAREPGGPFLCAPPVEVSKPVEGLGDPPPECRAENKSVKNRLTHSQPILIAAPVAMVATVGVVDYLTGLEYSADVFYLVPIAAAVWFVGRRYGIALAAVSAATSFAVNTLPKVNTSHLSIVTWNTLILLMFFLVVVGILSRLRELHRQLEQRVQERTAALRAEIAEREHLEKEILNVSEAERQRIGRDLHDSLGQQLTAAALAGKALVEQLTNAPVRAKAARQIVRLIEDGIDLARRLAHGLAPVELTAAGLMEAFEELTDTVSERFPVECQFLCDVPVVIPEATTATHLYRIAQEAINNALKHGHAHRIVVQLARTEAGTVLEIADDGVGLSDSSSAGRGMGLRIMAHRTAMLGGAFSARRAGERGTVVTCTVP